MHEQKKAYIVLQADMATQNALNTVALLSMGLARLEPDLVGPPVCDADGRSHPGISCLPVIIMKAKNMGKLQEAYTTMVAEGFSPVPFFEHSRVLGTYEEYQAGMRDMAATDLQISGFGVVGDMKTLKPHLKRFKLWK